MPKLAIQEEMLPGGTLDERIAKAAQMGLDGVEFRARDLDERLPVIATALEANGIAASGINMGRRDGCLSADSSTRRLAADALREALTCALDLGADYVSFVPLCGDTDLPDLTPFASAMDLQKELLIWLLRGVSDLADAMDTQLALQPVNHYETSFVTRLEQAAFFRRQVDNHPKITIAANLYHMALEEEDLLASLQQYGDDIGVLYLADNNRRLPGQGLLPFEAIGEALNAMPFEGWMVLEGSEPGNHQARAAQLPLELPDCLLFLRAAGIY